MSEGIPTTFEGKNIYGKEKFDRQISHEKVEEISREFKDFYGENGYIEVPPVKISSGIDPTVRFIGSHISVLKPEIIKDRIPSPGEYIVQNCIRTKNVQGLFNDEYFPLWGSCFTSLGALSRPERLDEVVKECLVFLKSKLSINEENICIRVSSADKDLLEAATAHLGEDFIEVDTRPEAYYRHKIGIEEIIGRNFNIALKNADCTNFSDIGNIIIIEKKGRALAVETALGSSTILKQLYGLDHVNDCFPLIELGIEDRNLRRKLEDSVIVATVLYLEGLEPRATDNKERILRSYVRAISYFRLKSKVSLDQIHQMITDFEVKQFGSSMVANKIINYLKTYEKSLSAGKITTEEDRIIASVL
mgnify:FL=1